MKKSLVELTIKKSGWKNKEVVCAVKELIESGSILYTDELLKICLDSTNPEDRWENVVEYLLDNLKDNAVDLICKLVYVDPFFKMLAFFNIYDYATEYTDDYTVRINNRKCKDIKNLHFSKNKKSFISWEPTYCPEDINYDISLKKDISYDPELLTYRFLDIILRRSTDIKDDLLEPNPIIIELLKRIQLLAFNIESIRKLTNEIFLYPVNAHNKKRLKALKSVLNIATDDYREITNRRHWLWFVLVEELQRWGIGVRPSFRKAGKILGGNSKTIARTYFKKKKELTEDKLNLENIIDEYNLKHELEHYLDKANI